MFNNIPPVTKNLLLLNILVYIVTLVGKQMGNDLDLILSAHYFNSPLFEPYQMITHMFTHSLSDPFHIIFNMFLLVMFGGHLERIWGAKRYFIFYFACGFGALALYNIIGVIEIHDLKNTIAEIGMPLDHITYMIPEWTRADILAMDNNLIGNYWWYSHSSMAGASGAIFGLLAGFALLFPNTRLMLLFPPIPIKAKYLIGAYLLFEVYNSIYRADDQIAHLAHVGGAIVGIVLVLIWRRFDKRNFY